MKFKESNIVLIKSLNKEGIIMNIGQNINTNQEEAFVFCENHEGYICQEKDLEFRMTFEESLQVIATSLEEESKTQA